MKLSGQISKEVYKKFKNGDSIGDTELAVARFYFSDVADRLSWLGPEFHLAWVEANRVATALSGYYDARNE